MMKNIFVALLITACAAAGFAEGLKLSGEAKTGIYWQMDQIDGEEPNSDIKLHSKDDAGGGMGRFRLNMEYENENGFGINARINWESWNNDNNMYWGFAYGYGNFFDNQLKVSIGKLAGSPWSTGGPEMWKELEENSGGGGMRIEYKPNFIPEEYGKVNIGFVLNWFNSDRDQGRPDVKASLADILSESVIGVSYTHSLFMVRFAYRLDSAWDGIQGNKDDMPNGHIAGTGEDELIYRVEERILQNYVPGLKFWAMGDLFGLSAEKKKEIQLFRNWAFVEYEPPEMWGMQRPFTAQLRFGHQQTGDEATGVRTELLIKPSFYWNFFDKLISVGAAFTLDQDYGSKMTEGSPYYYIEFEPKVQLNFQSSYIAFVYNFRREYIQEALKVPGYEPIKQIQWLNLRFCIYY
jgi:hypothetical protein